ncbi:hypothetical protein WAI453_005287 [Rhynchosporium graminicola]
MQSIRHFSQHETVKEGIIGTDQVTQNQPRLSKGIYQIITRTKISNSLSDFELLYRGAREREKKVPFP